MVRRRERLLPPAAPVDGEAARRERLGARGETLLVEVGGGGPLLRGRAAARRRPLLTGTLRQLALGGGDLLRHTSRKACSAAGEFLFCLGFLASLIQTYARPPASARRRCDGEVSRVCGAQAAPLRVSRLRVHRARVQNVAGRRRLVRLWIWATDRAGVWWREQVPHAQRPPSPPTPTSARHQTERVWSTAHAERQM